MWFPPKDGSAERRPTTLHRAEPDRREIATLPSFESPRRKIAPDMSDPLPSRDGADSESAKPASFASFTNPDPDTPGEHWRWCPRCGHELHNEKCKLRCPRCHYFMSCSDFD